MELNPVLTGLPAYPFARLQEARAQLLAARRALIDFSVGEPREPTPAFIRQALVDAITPQSTYPLAAGLPELRAAIAAWLQRRFGAPLDPDTAGHPDARLQGGDLPPRPRRRPGRGRRHDARLPGPRPRRALRRARGRRAARCARTTASARTSTGVDLDALAILWVNYPNNPTAATATLERLRSLGRAGARARLRPGQRRGLQRDLLRRRSRRRRCRSPTTPTSSSSTRCPSARRCPATAPALRPATPR